MNMEDTVSDIDKAELPDIDCGKPDESEDEDDPENYIL
jgi:hypothetical protein